MHKLKTSAIIPVKTFSKAKTRLNLQQDCKMEICSLMLQEVLKTISNCKVVNQIVLVSKDEAALKIGRQFNSIEIFDNESRVNNAIDLADQYLSDKNFDCSVIFPQDRGFTAGRHVTRHRFLFLFTGDSHLNDSKVDTSSISP